MKKMKWQGKVSKLVLMLSAPLSCFSCSSDSTLSEKGKPNIIFIYADDWGYGDLGIHGSTFIRTPNLDKMASEGMDFQNFTVSNPVCSPSRTAVLTGQFPARNSVHGHFASVESHIRRNMPDWLNPDAPMLPRMLKQAGYKTAHFGKWHLSNTYINDAPSPIKYGYDEFECFNISSQFKQMSRDSTIFRTMDFIERHKDETFFANVWIHATHTPHYPGKKYLNNYSHLPEQQQVYASVATEADYRIGLLFQKLKDLGIDKNTLVVFSSDNGPEITGRQKISPYDKTGKGLGVYYSVGETRGLKGKKRSLFAGGVRIPFIVRWPGVTPKGKVNKTTSLSAVDLLSTFVEISGAKFPDGFEPDGESIVKAIKGENFERTKPIYWQWLFANKRNWPSSAIEDGNWKLLYNEKMNRKELYQINEDWAEQKNVAEQYPERVNSMIQKIKEWEQTLPQTPNKSCFSKAREK